MINKLITQEKAIKMARDFQYKLISILDTIKSGKQTTSYLDKVIMLNDFADLIKYCDLIESLQFRKAQIFQNSLDTAVYEVIPNSLYNYIAYSEFSGSPKKVYLPPARGHSKKKLC